MATANLQNMYARVVHDLQVLLTFKGVEFEFEWYETAVPATTGRTWLRVTAPLDKYTLVNFREVRHDQTRGFYRQYSAGSYSGGVVQRTISPVPMRADSPVGTGGVFEVLTGVTADPVDAFSAIPLWGEAGVGNRPQGGGLNESAAIRIIPPGAVVLLEFENNSPDPADWYSYFKQWEVTPAALLEPGDV